MRSLDLVSHSGVKEILSDREGVLGVVDRTYQAHGSGRTVNPSASFLRFPDAESVRFGALPARVVGNDGNRAVGVKWIASVPENIRRGLPRASAVIILNDATNGVPYAILEGAAISAARTGASVAITLRSLRRTHGGDGRLGILGAGVIARSTVEFVTSVDTSISHVVVYDPAVEAACELLEETRALGLTAAMASAAEVLEAGTVLAATNRRAPHIGRAPTAGQVYFNVSLRDFTPESLVNVENIVDDVEHCLTGETSPHLAEQLSHNRLFISGTIPSLLAGTLRMASDSGVVVSPFGLGVLDVAVAEWVHKKAVERRLYTSVSDFFGSH